MYAQGDNQHTGGVTPLVLAARQGNLEAVKALAEAGAELNKPSGDGSSAMVVAVQNGHYDVARYLVAKVPTSTWPTRRGGRRSIWQ